MWGSVFEQIALLHPAAQVVFIVMAALVIGFIALAIIAKL